MTPIEAPKIYWLFGRPTTGRTELARALSVHLKNAGGFVTLLDGNDLRAGLCDDLGFSEADLLEKVRRGAHVAKIHASAGAMLICSFLTPKESHRRLVRQILGEDVSLIHIRCALEGCCRICKADGSQPSDTASESLSSGPDNFEPPAAIDAEISIHDRSLAASLLDLCQATTIVSEEPMKPDPWRERVESMGGVLSAREMDVMSLLSQGLRYKEMAEHLGISITTVRTHLERACVKLSAHSRTEAVARFVALSSQSS